MFQYLKKNAIFIQSMKNQVFSGIAIFWVSIILYSGCHTVKKAAISRDIGSSLKKSEIFRNHFTGFVLFDPERMEYISRVNSHLSFTPASNTKILTTLACLQALKDSIPAFLAVRSGDTTWIEPFGDPTFLHSAFPEQPVFNQLSSKPLLIHLPEDELKAFGPGWAWDDYHFSFQQQRSWFPVYGNEVRIFNQDSLQVVPSFFKDYVNVIVGEKPGSLVYREQKFNLFHIWMETDTSSFERKIPFDYSKELLISLLRDTLQQTVTLVDSFPIQFSDTLYNQALLPVLSLMMQESDNFLAEQLLAVAARADGFTNINSYREHLVERWRLPAEIRWVDGSGLSRYNLISPEVLIAILYQIYQQLDWITISSIFPTGGESGTLKEWYKGNPSYIVAKTGTLSNNHCLSGFLRTRSGRILIFSLMNNHYLKPVGEVKYEMERFLESIRDAY